MQIVDFTNGRSAKLKFCQLLVPILSFGSLLTVHLKSHATVLCNRLAGFFFSVPLYVK